MQKKPQEPSFKTEKVIVPMMCYCTFKPYPHFHRTSDSELEPWKWEKTHKFWNESKIKHETGNSPIKVSHRKNRRAAKASV